MDGSVVEWTTSALLIYHLYLDERHVGTVSLETFRILDAGELDVMRLVYEGKNNPEIADALFISRNTVKKHLQNIYEKTGVNSRMELVYVINMSSGEKKHS